MPKPLAVRSVRKVVEWPTPGAIYACQCRTIDGAEKIIGQGGTVAMPLGDPLSSWQREPGEDTFSPVNINGTNVIVQTDSPLVFPHMADASFVAQHPKTRVGSTAMGSWERRSDGRFDLWFVPAIGNPPNIGAAYEQEFALYRAMSRDFETWVAWPGYDNDIENVALRHAALRMTDAVVLPPADKTSYPFAHGIGGCGTVRAGDTLYHMLRCFYELPLGSSLGQQKNVLVRSRDDGMTFEAWMAGFDSASQPIWQPCANGLIPPELFAHGFAPYKWPVDAIYETPRMLASLPRADQFVGLTGQPEDPQFAIMFSPDLIRWGAEIKVELPQRYEGINYRTLNPDSGKMYFGANAEGQTATYEVVLDIAPKRRRRAAGRG